MFSKSLIAISLVATAVVLPAYAADVAGRFIFTVGEVSVQRGDSIIIARRGLALRRGDRVTAASKSIAQMRMADGAMISLRPETDFQIEDYVFAPTFVSAQAADQSDSSRSVYALLKGGLRVLSGLIGRTNKDAFQLNTLAATIGIRGTTFDVVCLGPCSSGAVVGASDGSILVSNLGGQIILENDEYALITADASKPRRLASPPLLVRDDLAAVVEPEELSGDVRSDSEDDRTDVEHSFSDLAAMDEVALESGREPSITDDTARPFRRAQRNIAFGAAPFADANSGDALVDRAVASNVDVSDADALLAFQGRAPIENANGDTELVPARLSIVGESAQNFDVGFDPVSGVRWGRWSGGTARLEMDAGDQTIDLSQASLHWIMDAAAEGSAQLPVSGDRSFLLFGNTDPTDQAGNRGVLGTASLNANFSAQTVTSSLNLYIADESWAASGSGNLGAGDVAQHFDGNYTNVTVDGVPGGSGEFSGFLTDNADGAGLQYVLDGGARQVSGAAAFRGEQ